MKPDYQVYKRHHNNKFLGWEVGYIKYEKKGKVRIETLKQVALFFNPKAKRHADKFVDWLDYYGPYER